MSSHAQPSRSWCRRLLGIAALLTLGSTASTARAEGVSFQHVFDQADQALDGGQGYKNAHNEQGLLGWGESYVLMSYATMFRATGDPRYLVALAEHGASVLASTDLARGVKDFAGRSRACWLSTKYSGSGNEPACWCVHTGMLAYPLADLVALVAAHPEHGALEVPGRGTLSKVAQDVLAGAEAAVAVHDAQYKSGPGSGEGHYAGDPAATFFAYAGKELPKNWSTALGRALLALYAATGKPVYKTRAEAIARYLKNRLEQKGGGWTWTYGGSETWTQGQGEDISHAAISVSFAARAQADGVVFSAADLQRFGRTIFETIHVDTNTVTDRVDGGGGTNTYTQQLGRWLEVAPFEPRVWPLVANLFRGVKSGSGSTLLGLANVARFAPPLWHYAFYTVDWQDLGATRRATAYGANLLVDPPDPTKVVALKLGYRAQRPASFQQWDGAAYHALHQMVGHTGNLNWVFLPYEPAIYKAYSGSKALYQFTDSFIAGEGIEVAEVEPVLPPLITTKSLLPATRGWPWSQQLTATGDPPWRWRLIAGPANMTLDPTTGELLGAGGDPAQAPQPVTVRLDNDSGHDSATFVLQTLPALPTPADDQPAALDLQVQADGTGARDGSDAAGSSPVLGQAGCGCRAAVTAGTAVADGSAAGWLALLFALALRRLLALALRRHCRRRPPL